MEEERQSTGKNIRELLKVSGCDSIQGYLDITHALSLIDTFWVKPVDSDLRWEKISLFRNSFNETIAKTAFEGGLHGHNFSTTSPEYGTDGSFAKCWIRENDQIKMLKREVPVRQMQGWSRIRSFMPASWRRNSFLIMWIMIFAPQVAESVRCVIFSRRRNWGIFRIMRWSRGIPRILLYCENVRSLAFLTGQQRCLFWIMLF